ncbi:MAG: thioredoxin domain-containing protein [Candidatus Krumholzibacteria bacterium]|nr:thioredoxin domain-containing protein [Candidatus Krumholzibacteria bacterium]
METAEKGNGLSNRLSSENNPYLSQHAGNPVDWFPWCDEAFEKAKAQDRPVFLSIGYSTCHWCHVMARESFEDERIAGILNSRFVSVKVDREERPDIDEYYMSFVTATNGSGGWPMSVFLDPEGRPFLGGTYFPPRDAGGRIGFERLLLSIADAWENRRGEISEMAERFSASLSAAGRETGGAGISGKILDEAFEQSLAIFDEENGGFGPAPKFPQAPLLKFMLLYGRKTGDGRALSMVGRTLDAMARGGINDQIGGGFHRYSTDERWVVPHFEKMLYDQAMAAELYVDAWKAGGGARFEEVARSILHYVLRDMTSAEGGFYSAEDADSGDGEGSFYVWKPAETVPILGPGAAALFNRYYGIGEKGNFENGSSVLHIPVPEDRFVPGGDLDGETVQRILADGRKALLEERAKRPGPAKDDKIMTAWNGLMISAFSRAGSALPDTVYIDSAIHAAVFVLENLHGDGKLKRYYRNGRAEGRGFLEDYAFMTAALIDLHEATSDHSWLDKASELADGMIRDFYDENEGGFFLAPKDASSPAGRTKPAYDGVIPSGNSAATIALFRLAALLEDERYKSAADKTLDYFSGRVILAFFGLV